MVTIFKKTIITKKAFSLVDILIAIALISLFLTSIIFILIDSRTATTRFVQKAEKTIEIENIIEKIQLVKQDSWMNVFETIGAGQFHVQMDENEKYTIAVGEAVLDDYSYFFESFYVYRDSENNIVTEGGIMDPYTVKLTVSIDWNASFLDNNVESFDVYLNNWNTKVWVTDNVEDFLAGEFDNTDVVSYEDGDISVGIEFYPDWCNPQYLMVNFDLPGQGVCATVSAVNGSAVAGTGENASGMSFSKVSVSAVDEITLVLDGTFDGHKTNDVFLIEDNPKILVATDTNSKEVVVVDIANKPYTEVGYFDAIGNKGSSSVFAANGRGYVAHENKISVFNLSSYNGARSQLGIIYVYTSSTKIYDIKVVGNYLYGAISSNNNDFVVIDVSDPSNMSIVGYLNANSAYCTSVWVSDDGNQVFLGCADDSNNNEAFMLDTTNKTGSIQVISSYDVGSTVKDVSFIEEDEKIILITSGTNNYVVLNLDGSSGLSGCGAINIPGTLLSIDSEIVDDRFLSYVLSTDSSREMHIIEGGPGGGGEGGYGYAPVGVYYSPIKDVIATESFFYALVIDGIIPQGTSMRFWIRTGDDPLLNDAEWVGPDGTSNTYFATMAYHDISELNISGRYVQFKTELYTNITSAPEIYSVKLYYE